MMSNFSSLHLLDLPSTGSLPPEDLQVGKTDSYVPSSTPGQTYPVPSGIVPGTWFPDISLPFPGQFQFVSITF